MKAVKESKYTVKHNALST